MAAFSYYKNTDLPISLYKPIQFGVGFNTPSIIKYNFWKMTLNNQKSCYASINLGECYCASEIEKQSICINSDISKVLKDLIKS